MHGSFALQRNLALASRSQHWLWFSVTAARYSRYASLILFYVQVETAFSIPSVPTKLATTSEGGGLMLSSPRDCQNWSGWLLVEVRRVLWPVSSSSVVGSLLSSWVFHRQTRQSVREASLHGHRVTFFVPFFFMDVWVFFS